MRARTMLVTTGRWVLCASCDVAVAGDVDAGWLWVGVLKTEITAFVFAFGVCDVVVFDPMYPTIDAKMSLPTTCVPEPGMCVDVEASFWPGRTVEDVEVVILVLLCLYRHDCIMLMSLRSMIVRKLFELNLRRAFARSSKTRFGRDRDGSQWVSQCICKTPNTLV